MFESWFFPSNPDRRKRVEFLGRSVLSIKDNLTELEPRITQKLNDLKQELEKVKGLDIKWLDTDLDSLEQAVQAAKARLDPEGQGGSWWIRVLEWLTNFSVMFAYGKKLLNCCFDMLLRGVNRGAELVKCLRGFALALNNPGWIKGIFRFGCGILVAAVVMLLVDLVFSVFNGFKNRSAMQDGINKLCTARLGGLAARSGLNAVRDQFCTMESIVKLVNKYTSSKDNPKKQSIYKELIDEEAQELEENMNKALNLLNDYKSAHQVAKKQDEQNDQWTEEDPTLEEMIKRLEEEEEGQEKAQQSKEGVVAAVVGAVVATALPGCPATLVSELCSAVKQTSDPALLSTSHKVESLICTFERYSSRQARAA